MAIVRVDVKDHYGVGELWSSAENAGEAVEEARRWCDANPPWELRTAAPVRGADGHYKVELTREYQAGG